jgi:hypothetical protein
MPAFTIIQNLYEIPANLVEAKKFNHRDQFVYKNDRRYKLVSKKESPYSCMERTARCCLGLLAIIVTLGFALCSVKIQHLFTAQKKHIRYAILESEHQSNLPISIHQHLNNHLNDDVEKDKLPLNQVLCAEEPDQSKKPEHPLPSEPIPALMDLTTPVEGTIFAIGKVLTKQEAEKQLDTGNKEFYCEELVLGNLGNGQFQFLKLLQVFDGEFVMVSDGNNLLYKHAADIYKLRNHAVSQPEEIAIGERPSPYMLAHAKKVSPDDPLLPVGALALVHRSGPPPFYQIVKITDVNANNEIVFDFGTDQYIKKHKTGFLRICTPFIIKELSVEPVMELTPEEIQAKDLNGEAARSIQMRSFLSNFPNYQFGQIVIDGKHYVPLTGNVPHISTKPVISCGSTINRELTVLDPENSALLNKHYKHINKLLCRLKRETKNGFTEKMVVDLVSSYTNQIIFPRNSNSIQNVENIITNWTGKTIAFSNGISERQIPVIPIDEFIKKKIGVCRHHALVVCYILDRLTKESEQDRFIYGIVQHMRDNLPKTERHPEGAHIWATFMSAKGNRWHIDTFWNRIVDFNVPQEKEVLKQLYGAGPIENQIRRTHEAHKIALGDSKR